MGKEKYLKKVEALFRESPVVNYSSLRRIVRNEKNDEYAKQLVRNLIIKGKIRKLVKGCYTTHNDSSLSVFCLEPAYLGLQDALSFHNLWEQETVPVIITTRKVRPGIRQVLGTNVLVRRIQKKYFFGLEYLEQGGVFYPYSDKEKTLIDMVYFKEKMSTELIGNIQKQIDRKKLEKYLKNYPLRTQKLVLKIL
jgi:predicted transcriptional regulator of viral defense system